MGEILPGFTTPALIALCRERGAFPPKHVTLGVISQCFLRSASSTAVPGVTLAHWCERRCHCMSKAVVIPSDQLLTKASAGRDLERSGVRVLLPASTFTLYKVCLVAKVYKYITQLVMSEYHITTSSARQCMVPQRV